MDKLFVLCSGGLDSVTAAFVAKRDFSPKELVLLFVDYGQRSLREERFCVEECAKVLGAEVRLVDMTWLHSVSTSLINSDAAVPKKELKDIEDVSLEQKDVLMWWVPCRNALFVLAGFAHAEKEFLEKKSSCVVVMGIKKEGDISFRDSSPEFVQGMNSIVPFCGHDEKLRLLTPLMDYDKDEIVVLGNSLGVPFEKTVSCYAPKGFKENIPVQCGVCSACRQRQAAFYWAGVTDPSVYE